MIKMTNPRLIELAKRTRNKDLPKEPSVISSAPLVIPVSSSPNVNGLESRLDFQRNLRNEYKVTAGDETIFYLGEARGLWFEGRDIRGQAVLSKYSRKIGEKETKNLVRKIPPKFETVRTPYNIDTLVWQVKSGEFTYEGFMKKGIYDCIYFLSNGESKIGYDCSAHYRAKLLGEANNQGISLTPKLFDEVFGPIDKKIMELYESNKRFSQKP